MKTIKFYNPFFKIGGYPALMTGLLAMMITASVGWWLNVHFNGNLQVAIMPQRGILFTVAEHVVPWLVYSLIFFFLGSLLSKSRIRLIDVAGSFALARLPLLLIVFTGLFDFKDQILEKLIVKATERPGGLSELGFTGGEIAFITLYVVVLLAVIIWFIALLYNAYRISCNLAGTKLVVSFIVGILAAESLSKLLIYLVYYRF